MISAKMSLASEGIKLLMPGREALPKFLRVPAIVRQGAPSQRPDDAAHFLAAEMQALRYVMSHRDETVKLTQEITGAKPDDPRAAYIYDLAVKTNAIDPELPIPMDRLEWLQDRHQDRRVQQARRPEQDGRHGRPRPGTGAGGEINPS